MIREIATRPLPSCKTIIVNLYSMSIHQTRKARTSLPSAGKNLRELTQRALSRNRYRDKICGCARKNALVGEVRRARASTDVSGQRLTVRSIARRDAAFLRQQMRTSNASEISRSGRFTVKMQNQDSSAERWNAFQLASLIRRAARAQQAAPLIVPRPMPSCNAFAKRATVRSLECHLHAEGESAQTK
jgi:hypothetical protein